MHRISSQRMSVFRSKMLLKREHSRARTHLHGKTVS
uniref:Uncharacterized protein n=1 Tax=Anguilla anguilla TaxID=7936 RepID=A0A0E9US79_ANGAN